MFDQNEHRTILVRILKEIYADPVLRTTLGFKGGTAAYLFYGLLRLSVDLDFDLIKPESGEVVFNCLKIVLGKFGTVKNSRNKRFTIFVLLDYGKDKRKVKVEVSKRKTSADFQLQSYLGIPMLVMAKPDLAAGKLAAFLTRRKFAARDLFDLWYFLDQEWTVNPVVFEEKAGMTFNEGLQKAIEKAGKVKDNQLLQGLGELLSQDQKKFVKEKMRNEVVFLLKLYRENLSQENRQREKTLKKN